MGAFVRLYDSVVAVALCTVVLVALDHLTFEECIRGTCEVVAINYDPRSSSSDSSWWLVYVRGEDGSVTGLKARDECDWRAMSPGVQGKVTEHRTYLFGFVRHAVKPY